MAFNRKLTASIGATPTVVTNTITAGKTHTIHGLTVANITSGAVAATVTMTDGTNTVNIVKGISIPANDSLGVMGMDFKHNLIAGDSISVVSDTAASLDVLCSYLEQ